MHRNYSFTCQAAMKNFSSVILMFAVIILFIQDSIAQHKKISLTAAPVLLPFRTIGIQPGVQIRLSDRWAIVAEFCYAAPPETRTKFDKIRIFRTSAEMKRFLTKRGNIAYLSFQPSYSYRLLVKSDEGYFYQKNDMAWYTHAEAHSPILSFSLKAGVEIKTEGNFYVDFYVGMGSRTIFTRYETDNPKYAPLEYPRHVMGPIPAYRYNYTFTRFHMPIGMRLGVRI